MTGERSDHPSWWLDWSGECVAIVASGPSTKQTDVLVLRNRIHVIAIKQNYDLCPWADVVYGCDAAWWQYRNGLPDFNGLKLSWSDGGCRHFPDIKKVDIEKTTDRILLDQIGHVGSGGNSGFQALNLAVQFGATGIILIGFDMYGPHWYGRNGWWMANNPSQENFQRWQKAFHLAVNNLSALGIEVINASPISSLKCFKHKTVVQTLEGWGL